MVDGWIFLGKRYKGTKWNAGDFCILHLFDSYIRVCVCVCVYVCMCVCVCMCHTFPSSVGFSGGSAIKILCAYAGDASSIPGSGRNSGEGNGNPLQHFQPGKSHTQRSLAGYNPWGCKRVRHDRATQTTTTQPVLHARVPDFILHIHPFSSIILSDGSSSSSCPCLAQLFGVSSMDY